MRMKGLFVACAIVASLACRSWATAGAEPQCPVFLRTHVTAGDAVGERFVETIREELMTSPQVSMATSEDAASLVARIVTMSSGSHATTVAVVLTLHALVPTLPTAAATSEPKPHMVDLLMQGPALVTYPEPTIREGAARYVNWIVDRTMVAACERVRKTLPDVGRALEQLRHAPP
jgi:hypothetical protein